ncbi:MAG: hypothetical protein RL417_1043 [Pseudomonadota bacterium]|jgi:periplasmic divalent cation tolerance protein
MAMNSNLSIRLVFITAPSPEIGAELARQAVEGQLVACVNILPGVRSVYRWEGKVTESTEVLLIAKTTAEGVPRLERFIRENHPYDTPEFVVVEPDTVESRYAEWLAGAVK